MRPSEVRDIRIQRLETLADLWGKAYLFHPSVVRSDLDVDWSRVLIDAIPRIEQAGTTDEFVAALNEHLFAPLHDPSTRAQRAGCRAQGAPGTSPAGAESVRLVAQTLTPAIGYVAATQPRRYPDPSFLDDFRQAVTGLGFLDLLVVDLRWQDAKVPAAWSDYFLACFITAPVSSGSRLARVHEGWNETNEAHLYRQKWQLTPGFALKPSATITTPTIFLINNTSCAFLAPTLDALQAQPQIAVVLQRTDEMGIPVSSLLRYPEEIAVHFDPDLLISHQRALGFQPDLIVEQSLALGDLPGLARHVLESKHARQSDLKPAFLFGMRFPLPDPVSSDPLTREQRLLGLFKIWIVVRYFFPHLDLAAVDWPAILREWIPRVESAETLEDYYVTLRRLAAQLDDSHAGIWHPVLDPGDYTLPIRLARVEEKVVVVETRWDQADVPLNRGEEIVAIDGLAIDAFEAHWRTRIPASTQQGFWRSLYGFGIPFRGPKDSAMELAVRREVGIERILLARSVELNAWYQASEQNGDCQVLASNVGFVNLVTIPTLAALDDALVTFKDTNGLVLDLRGYPQFALTLDLVSRLCSEPVKGAVFEIPVVAGYAPLAKEWLRFQYVVEPHPEIGYRKPVVLLIDERTISMAEDLCIYLKHAGRVTFVGSRTAGTSGNVTRIHLPGGGVMTFTGMCVRFGDGSRFQNRGIQPDVEVRPTIDGIRNGIDEVLEKGLVVLRDSAGSGEAIQQGDHYLVNGRLYGVEPSGRAYPIRGPGIHELGCNNFL